MANLRNILKVEQKEKGSKKTYFMFESGKPYYDDVIEVRNQLGPLANELVGMFLVFLNQAPDQDVQTVLEMIRKKDQKKNS